MEGETQGVFWATISKLAVAVPIALALGAGLSALVLGGIDYGQLKSSLDTEKTRSAQLEKLNEEFRQANEKWRDAYTKLNSELSSANARLVSMQNDQCESIRNDISRLQFKIEEAYGFVDSGEKRGNMQIMMRQHQESLQACFAARR
ncbi:hypothetical protein [Pseudomonas protegens]|uniref:hypothetical protein n=1 Tax=Pseudomonas protegens TaxID=380021 RepID=UPI0023ED986E|nr:hypothetical protein [Pseudomonas protegens]MDF4205082.1 hypothetical protein [Pseudomonas protegens]MDK1397945.1 hypothetical protein [Pseudomonas protegens]